MNPPLPGTILLTTIKGPAGAFVGLGQLISGDASRYQHAGIVDEDGSVIEAAPGGVRKVPLARYLDGRPLAFGWMIPLTDGQRAMIVAEARTLLRRPYGWSTYLLLALMRLGIKPRWLRERVGTYQRLVCSTLVDLAYLRAGLHLFSDGREPGSVTPGDIANVFIETDWRAGP